MKKNYIAPTATTVFLTSEDRLLAGSINASIDSTGDGESNVVFESNQKGGWQSSQWSEQED